MNIFTEKELNILYLALSRQIAKKQEFIQEIDEEKNPLIYSVESNILEVWQDLQEKLDGMIFSLKNFQK